MRKVISAIILLHLGNVFGQVPGFLGKKIAVGCHMDMGLLPWSLLNGGINYEGEERSINLNSRQNIALEYVVGRDVSIEASVGFSKTGMFTKDNEPEDFTYEYPALSGNSPYVGSYRPYRQNAYDYLRVDNRLYRIGINVFSGNYVAPQGNYWNFSYIQNRGSVQYVYNGIAKDLSVITSHGVMITKGYRRIIMKSFIFDIGIGFGTVFGEYEKSEKSSEDFNKEDGTISIQTDLLNEGLWFNGHIGLKYLIPKLGN